MESFSSGELISKHNLEVSIFLICITQNTQIIVPVPLLWSRYKRGYLEWTPQGEPLCSRYPNLLSLPFPISKCVLLLIPMNGSAAEEEHSSHGKGWSSTLLISLIYTSLSWYSAWGCQACIHAHCAQLAIHLVSCFFCFNRQGWDLKCQSFQMAFHLFLAFANKSNFRQKTIRVFIFNVLMIFMRSLYRDSTTHSFD